MLSVLNTLVYFYHRSFPGLPMLSLCSRVRKFLSLLYRKYYQYAEPEILLQLYIYLVHPHQEYASPVWNPYLQKNINTLEDVQKYALRMCSKYWDQAYSRLLQLFHIPTLSQRRLHLDFCTMFKIVHGLFEFPLGIHISWQNSKH